MGLDARADVAGTGIGPGGTPTPVTGVAPAAGDPGLTVTTGAESGGAAGGACNNRFRPTSASDVCRSMNAPTSAGEASNAFARLTRNSTCAISSALLGRALADRLRARMQISSRQGGAP